METWKPWRNFTPINKIETQRKDRTKSFKIEIVRMKKEGYKNSEIAENLGMTANALKLFINRHGLGLKD
jgi:transposase-like protein